MVREGLALSTDCLISILKPAHILRTQAHTCRSFSNQKCTQFCCFHCIDPSSPVATTQSPLLLGPEQDLLWTSVVKFVLCLTPSLVPETALPFPALAISLTWSKAVLRRHLANIYSQIHSIMDYAAPGLHSSITAPNKALFLHVLICFLEIKYWFYSTHVEMPSVITELICK